ncbi:hypothetical protein JDV02_002842 [Purpureocillium takamizusanense]|uniref:Uncharacterized protein n=1 Tax=Purpureocillium takamizusanense TaxID=2060973 RepID=A0A9Q8QBV6_9HYPO|nr:uncharacterized protein JDV02_002842 [Purpureocillium takamizusanense]UNI16407.1 hypothetical protein JDV02_002842 [Purpureocillium takamizusanense]
MDVGEVADCGKAAAPQSQTRETRALKKQAGPTQAQPTRAVAPVDGARSIGRLVPVVALQQQQQQHPAPSTVGLLLFCGNWGRGSICPVGLDGPIQQIRGPPPHV